MPRSPRKLWTEAVLWLIAEIILSSSGIDTLADYSEFLLNQRTAVNTPPAIQTVVADTALTKHSAICSQQ